MKKDSCRKWLIFSDHEWSQWKDYKKIVMVRRGEPGEYQAGILQSRRCIKCGKLETKEVLYL